MKDDEKVNLFNNIGDVEFTNARTPTVPKFL